MKTVVYHSADNDGKFSKEVAKHFLGTEGVEYIGWDHGNAPLKFPHDSEKVYVLDLPPHTPFGMTVDEVQHVELIWIDHHATAMEEVSSRVLGYRIDGVAACRLTWQWFIWNVSSTQRDESFLSHYTKQSYVDRKVDEPVLIRLLGEYDIWDKRDPDAQLLQYGLRHLTIPEANMRVMLDTPKGIYHLFLTEILHRGKMIKELADADNASIMKTNGFDVEFEGLKFLACNNARFNTALFDSAVSKRHDAELGFCYMPNGVWKISMYGVPDKPDIDLSVIAKKYGGGGHKGACGFTCNNLPFLPCA